MKWRGQSLGTKADLLDAASVRHAYRRWAPVYDFTFGTVAEAGRKHAVKIINRRRGRVLEVGVGTGLSLPCYEKHLTVTGIDLSPEMLDKATSAGRAAELANVAGLHEMDAGALAFPDESFDTVVAMYVMTVVPDAEKVMRELERVCATGGEVILVNHFSQEEGVRGFVERRLAPLATSIGWHAVFTLDRVLVCEDLAARRAEDALALRALHHAPLRQAAGLWPRAAARILEASVARAKALPPMRSRLPEPVKVRIKWQVARSRVVGRRLLDTRYWRSLYRRLSSQMAE